MRPRVQGGVRLRLPGDAPPWRHPGRRRGPHSGGVRGDVAALGRVRSRAPAPTMAGRHRPPAGPRSPPAPPRARGRRKLALVPLAPGRRPRAAPIDAVIPWVLELALVAVAGVISSGTPRPAPRLPPAAVGREAPARLPSPPSFRALAP